jgi:hypothetical protein
MTQPTHRPAGKRPGRPGASASNSTTTSTPLSPSTKRPVSIPGRTLRAARRRSHAVRRDHPRHQGTHSMRVPHLHQSSSNMVMTLAGTARCAAYLMGNHVKAETMCRHDPPRCCTCRCAMSPRDATTNRPGSPSTSRAVSSVANRAGRDTSHVRPTQLRSHYRLPANTCRQVGVRRPPTIASACKSRG